MGGGNSKTKTESIKPTEQGQVQLQAQAQPQPAQGPSSGPGPSSRPNLNNSPQKDMDSPIKMQGRVTSKPLANPHQLSHNPSEDDFVDHSTPGTLAKKTKQNARAQGAVRQPEASQNMATVSSHQSPQKSDPMQAKMEQESLRKKQQEDDKIKQLQVIKEQQKAKQAAAAAQAASAKKREPTIGSIRQDTNGTEIFAQHESPQKPAYGLGYSNNKNFTGGLDDSGASGDYRGLDMQIQGKGLMNRDESQNYLGSAAVAAPQTAQVNFKVVDYGGNKKNKENEINYANNGTLAGIQSSGIHMGIMADNNNKDDAQNRNIDMAELNELLGM